MSEPIPEMNEIKKMVEDLRANYSAERIADIVFPKIESKVLGSVNSLFDKRAESLEQTIYDKFVDETAKLLDIPEDKIASIKALDDTIGKAWGALMEKVDEWNLVRKNIDPNETVTMTRREYNKERRDYALPWVIASTLIGLFAGILLGILAM